ncbi:hypothetical protein Q5P01_000402 [Channa striata]|uniref:C-type lectin domain-containing protein n=1 Tax=Channa striata TaxID=64152 RepID=A0AA88LIB4_CHASR|nr:hypothetical protein Q5P01_000402 [Channa striata]
METQVSATVVQSPDGRPPKADGEAAACSRHFFLAACLLTLVNISVVIYIRVIMHEQEASLNKVTAENQQLITSRSILQTQRDYLNWTLGAILNFDTFPVNVYCPQKKCQSCQTGWIQFQEKCYLFYENPAPWKTWPQSREFCQNKTADLAVIHNLQEQEFVTNNTKFYFDQWHGYFLGLFQTADKNWVWVDGHNDTLQYWVTDKLQTPDTNGTIYALLIPNRNVTANWNRADNKFENKFICERKALI